MTRKTKNTNSKNQPTFGQLLPPNLQRFWEELQRKYYLEKYELIDFVPETLFQKRKRIIIGVGGLRILNINHQ